ncbi:MAG: hypothetical protein IPM49_09315 [Flavobacteriales bacterium]|nr:hypothetical protein [Flavobacteriales bacterium]
MADRWDASRRSGLVLWLVWSVLRDRSVPVRDLGAREQWGYQDRPDIRPVEER